MKPKPLGDSMKEKISKLHALIWHAIITKGFDIPNSKQLSDEIWDDIERSFKQALEEVEKDDKELFEKLMHKELSELTIDPDNYEYIKSVGEVCGKLRYDIVERALAAFSKLKSQLKDKEHK